MKKMHNKGFTLVELLAMLTVLAVLMIVAIPNISQILKNSRMNQVKMDARKMVDSAKIKISKDNKKTIIEKNKYYYIFSLDYLDTNDDIKKGPNGGEYDKYSSFVIYNRSDGTPHYYVRLIEKKNNDYYVLTKDSKNITEIDEITKKDSTIEVKKVNSISTVTKDDYKVNDPEYEGKIEIIIDEETCRNISVDHDDKFFYITGDINCPANSYSGIANVDDDGTPCTEGDTCHPRSTCICYNDNEVYNSSSSQCVPKS